MKVKFWLGMNVKRANGDQGFASGWVIADFGDTAEVGSSYSISPDTMKEWSDDMKDQLQAESVVIMSISPMFGKL